MSRLELVPERTSGTCGSTGPVVGAVDGLAPASAVLALGDGQRPYSAPMTSKFRTVAMIEAFTYLVLLACVVVKRGLDGPDLVSVMGPIHGIAFLAYFVLTLAVRDEQGWTVGQTILVLVASALPFGAFVVNSRMVHDPVPTTAG